MRGVIPPLGLADWSLTFKSQSTRLRFADRFAWPPGKDRCSRNGLWRAIRNKTANSYVFGITI
jgi:hypothetical protein